MEIAKAALLGAIQGLTEFLPVSSTAHLIIAERLLNFDPGGFTFDVIAHFGTLLALLVYFRRDWLGVLTEVIEGLKPRRHNEPRARLLLLLILGTIPGAAIGFFLEPYVESLRSASLIVFTLISVGVLFIAIERWSKKERDFTKLRGKDALLIGTAQAIALLPGVSRSGITITTGLSLGLTREAATRFAFMLSAPIIFGAGLKALLGADFARPGLAIMLAGFLASAVSGYLAVSFMLSYLKKHSLISFAYYRFALAIVIGILILAGKLY